MSIKLSGENRRKVDPREGIYYGTNIIAPKGNSSYIRLQRNISRNSTRRKLNTTLSIFQRGSLIRTAMVKL